MQQDPGTLWTMGLSSLCCVVCDEKWPLKITMLPLVKPVGKSDCPHDKKLVCSKMLSFFSSCQENTCDVPKPKYDSKELPSNQVVHFAMGIQIFKGQKFTKFTLVLIGSFNILKECSFSGQPHREDVDAGRQDRSEGWASPPLHSASENGPQALEIKLPKGGWSLVN